MLFATGPGSEVRRPLAVVVGGFSHPHPQLCKCFHASTGGLIPKRKMKSDVIRDRRVSRMRAVHPRLKTGPARRLFLHSKTRGRREVVKDL